MKTILGRSAAATGTGAATARGAPSSRNSHTRGFVGIVPLDPLTLTDAVRRLPNQSSFVSRARQSPGVSPRRAAARGLPYLRQLSTSNIDLHKGPRPTSRSCPMNPSRAFVRLFPGVAAVALLTFTVPHALAVDAPKGSLRSREFAAADLAVSSSHVPLDDVLAELPNRAAWERFRGERASGGAERVHVYIDPRSGAATDIIAPFPLLPGDGVGNHVALADLRTRLGREVESVDAAVVADAARLFVVEHAGVLGIAPAQIGTLRVTQVASTLWQVSAPQVVGGITVRDARLALTISHGNVVAFGTEGWGNVVLT